MSEIAIKVEGLGKQFRIGSPERYRTLRDTLTDTLAAPFRLLGRLSRGEGAVKAPSETIWALKDVSFEVKHGQVIGIIGRNGAGKSTLLKILSRITEPTEGYAEIHGRVGSLLEVGTGFHPELTGRENIFLNGAILGMKKAEILRKFDEIVAFAEVEKFIDTPVKHYSSGMYVRLAFAVAAHLEPEILIVDEVLAVGDSEFQKKCLGKMGDVAKEGRTVMFVSHNMAAVESLCSRGIQMDRGVVIYDGEALAAVRNYFSSSHNEPGPRDLSSVGGRTGSGEIRFVNAEVTNARSPADFIYPGDALNVRLGFQCGKPIREPVFSAAIYERRGHCLFAILTSDLDMIIPAVETSGSIELVIERPNFLPGRYWLHCAVGDHHNPHRFDHVLDAVCFDVQPADVYHSGRLAAAGWSSVFFDCRWHLNVRQEVNC
jgi:lipopolysaccharide transport system ATP-binding protein